MSERTDSWIKRINSIAALHESEREALRQACAERGYHLKSGECFLTATPIHVCYDCLAEFYEAPETPSPDIISLNDGDTVMIGEDAYIARETVDEQGIRMTRLEKQA